MREFECCIVGGGPAGTMLGYLLARAGIKTIVLEKHADFFRDFRGDTIHPSTLQIMHELGLLEQLLKLPHQKTYKLRGYIEDHPITVADFSKLKVECPYIAFMPQWDFLNFLNKQAEIYPQFTLLQQTEAVDLITENDRVIGVKARRPDGLIELRAKLIVAADGRGSTIRASSGLKVKDIGAPIDVLWFRISRDAKDPDETFGKFSAGRIFIAINRQDYWQCGFVIAKGAADQIKQQAIEDFRAKIAVGLPFLSDRLGDLKSWDDVKLLTVKIDRLEHWYKPGLLCIGDAAHAMSPVGGVGINLAIQDAVAAANILIKPLQENTLCINDLAAVQKRRLWPVKVIQIIQALVQKRIIYHVLQQGRPLQIPWLVKKLQSLSLARRIVGHLIGVGVRPERIEIGKLKHGRI